MKKTIQQFENMVQQNARILERSESSRIQRPKPPPKPPMVKHRTIIAKQNSLISHSIKHCPVDLNTRSFVMKAMFTMLSPLKYEAMVFLFEDITSTDEQQYIYIDSIPMNNLSIKTFDLQSLLFHLINFSKMKDLGGPQERYTYILQSNSLQIKENWVQCIENKLWEQLKQCKGSMTCLNDNITVRTWMKKSHVDISSPNFQLSQVLQQGMESQNDTKNAAYSIKYCPVDLHSQGSLLMKDAFSVQKPKCYEAMVFLFEEIIVFTLYQDEMEGFPYVDHIKMSDLSIPSSRASPTVLQLSDYAKVKNGEVGRDMFVLEAKSTKTRDIWIKIIEKQLWSQLEQTKHHRHTYS